MKMVDDSILKSGKARVWVNGRWRTYVYYVVRGKQRHRLWVKPRDPRTPGQLWWRARLGAFSKAWSQSPELTEKRRAGWRREGAKVRSRPRLMQSGPLTGSQRFVGRNCAKGRMGLGVLWEAGEKAEGRRQNAATSQVQRLQRVARSTWERHQSAIRPPCGHHEVGKKAEGSPPSAVSVGRTGTQKAEPTSQVTQSQGVARSTSERCRSNAQVQRSCHARRSGVYWPSSRRCRGLCRGSNRGSGQLAGCGGSGGRERLARE